MLVSLRWGRGGSVSETYPHTARDHVSHGVLMCFKGSLSRVLQHFLFFFIAGFIFLIYSFSYSHVHT